MDLRDAESANEYPDRPLWRGRICDLLNDDLSFFGKAKILVCLPDEPFDEENLGDTDVGVLFLSDGDLQMTSFRWCCTSCKCLLFDTFLSLEETTRKPLTLHS